MLDYLRPCFHLMLIALRTSLRFATVSRFQQSYWVSGSGKSIRLLHVKVCKTFCTNALLPEIWLVLPYDIPVRFYGTVILWGLELVRAVFDSRRSWWEQLYGFIFFQIIGNQFPVPWISEAYSEPCQTSQVERFAKIVKAF